MTECPFIAPYPKPPKRKPGLLRRFYIGMNSWIHLLYARSYTMKMGETRLPKLNMFTVNELNLVHDVLDDKEKQFPKHWLNNLVLDDLVADSVFVVNGETWEHQRQMVNPAFVHIHLKQSFSIMLQAAQELVARMREAVEQSHDSVIDIDPMMTHVTADIIVRTIFSKTLSQKAAADIYKSFNLYQKYAQRNVTLSVFGLPDFGIRNKMKKASRAVHAVFAPFVADRFRAREAGEKSHYHDIMETLLNARHPVTGAAFTQAELTTQIAVIFLAGHETSASALSWTLYLLSECTEWQTKVRAERAQVTQGSDFAYEHLKKMEIMRNVFREGLRLYPPVSFMPRMITAPTKMRDKELHTGDLVLAAPWLVHRNAENWVCPHGFAPERYETEEGAKSLKNAWIPFGRGPRICPGSGFAQQEAAIILSEIVEHFDLSYTRKTKPDLTARLTLRPKGGIWLKAVLRHKP
jgi:cytochrome P450